MRHALAIVALAVAAGAQAADPVAFVADLKGNAMIEGNGKVVFLAELAPDTRLLLGTGASLAITASPRKSRLLLGDNLVDYVRGVRSITTDGPCVRACTSR